MNSPEMVEIGFGHSQTSIVEHCSQGGLRDRSRGQLPSHHRGRAPCFQQSLVVPDETGEIKGRTTSRRF